MLTLQLGVFMCIYLGECFLVSLVFPHVPLTLPHPRVLVPFTLSLPLSLTRPTLSHPVIRTSLTHGINNFTFRINFSLNDILSDRPRDCVKGPGEGGREAEGKGETKHGRNGSL